MTNLSSPGCLRVPGACLTHEHQVKTEYAQKHHELLAAEDDALQDCIEARANTIAQIMNIAKCLLIEVDMRIIRDGMADTSAAETVTDKP